MNCRQYLWALSLVAVVFGASSRPIEAQDGHNAGIEVSLEPLDSRLDAPVVTALASSQDGRYVAAAGDDHAIRLFQAETGTIARTLAAHTDWIRVLAFSSDSRQLYSGGDDGRVVAWDTSQQDRSVEIVRLPFAVRSLSFATQKRLLAIGGFGDTVGVWDVAAENWKFQFSCDSGDQRCVRFSPSGNQLLSCGRDGRVRVWDIASGQKLFDYSAHIGRIHTAAFSTDEQFVTSVGEDRKLVRYDLRLGRVALERELHGSKLLSMCLVNDYLVAAAGADNTIRIYDTLADIERGRLKGHTGSVAVMCTSGSRLVSGAFDTTMRIWDLTSALRPQEGIAKPVGMAPLTKDSRVDIR